jgi:hypothetical protein
LRIPNKDNDGFGKVLNALFVNIEDAYLRSMKPILTTTEINVMLQDGSVTKSSTFDPQSTIQFYRSFLKDLQDWEVGDIQEKTG